MLTPTSGSSAPSPLQVTFTFSPASLAPGGYPVVITLRDAANRTGFCSLLVVAPAAVCGNGVRQPGEACDGTDVDPAASCAAGYTGAPLCENDVANPAGDGSCTLGSDGCVDIDECTEGTAGCSADATCSNEPGAFSCVCRAGFTGDGFACADIDECGEGLAGCDAQATCDNTPGGFTCTCVAGWDGTGFACADVDECADAHSCSRS